MIVFEQAHHRGGAATEVAAGFSTRILEFCARHGIEHASVHTATLKKFATGKGNADKNAMQQEARRRFKPDLADDNEADALWILEWACREILGDRGIETGKDAQAPVRIKPEHPPGGMARLFEPYNQSEPRGEIGSQNA